MHWQECVQRRVLVCTLAGRDSAAPLKCYFHVHCVEFLYNTPKPRVAPRKLPFNFRGSLYEYVFRGAEMFLNTENSDRGKLEKEKLQERRKKSSVTDK